MSDLLQRLSRELGCDAVEVANAKHPELAKCSDAQVARLTDAVDAVLAAHSWPTTSDYCERAYAALKSDGILEEILPPAAPPAPRTFETSEAEESYLRRAPLEEVRQYLEQKYAK